MTAVHIDIIHGDHFLRMEKPRPVQAAALLDPLTATRSMPGAESLKLHWLQGRPVYIETTGAKKALVDARTGSPVPAPSQDQIRQLADYWFTGEERLARVTLVHDLPFEIRGAKPPLWRADFGGWNKPTLYFSPETGELVTRRHELWRIFDFVWMLHIMDYEERENVNNWVLRTFTWAAVAMALSGAWLLLYNLPRRRRRKVRP